MFNRCCSRCLESEMPMTQRDGSTEMLPVSAFICKHVFDEKNTIPDVLVEKCTFETIVAVCQINLNF